MNGCDDEIELAEHVVTKIERAIAQNVAFDAGENAECAVELAIQSANRSGLRTELRRVDAVRLDRAAAVIGDPEILQTELARGGDHFLERVVSIARRRVAMERAAQILPLDQARQFVLRGRVELAAVLAQLRRNEIEIEGTIQLRLGAN